MSEFEVFLSLLNGIKDKLEELKKMEKIGDYLLEDVFFQREPQSTTFKVTLDFFVNIKKKISEEDDSSGSV